jgi:hypothetical protein
MLVAEANGSVVRAESLRHTVSPIVSVLALGAAGYRNKFSTSVCLTSARADPWRPRTVETSAR